jgi:2-polyprenyl-3-methyl-5-hydroxy-6-metoxy-1,4-benzoquinol methylase
MDDSLYEEMYRTEKRHWWFVGRRAVVRNMMSRFVDPEDKNRWRICEVGCGAGGNLEDLADRHEVVGVDASERALEFARKRLGANAKYGSLPDDIDLPRDSFDIVLSTDVFEHVEDDLGSAKTAVSLLRQGGILVATVPAYQWLYSPRDKHHQHFRRYGKRQFAELFEQEDVRVELLSYYNTFLFPAAAAARLWSKYAGREEQPGDLQVPASPLNAALATLFGAEKWLLGRVPSPFGLSLIAVVRKLDSAQAAYSKAA